MWRGLCVCEGVYFLGIFIFILLFKILLYGLFLVIREWDIEYFSFLFFKINKGKENVS